jgi:hypothetical protein
MPRLKMGRKPGGGGALKVTLSNADDPFATADSAKGKFLFNSDDPNIPYEMFKFRMDPNAATYPVSGTPGTNLFYFWPAGSTVATAKVIIVSRSAPGIGGNSFAFIFLWDRIYGASFAPFYQILQEGSAGFSSNYQENFEIPGEFHGSPGSFCPSTFASISIAREANDFQVCKPNAATGTLYFGSLFGHVLIEADSIVVPGLSYGGYYSRHGRLATQGPAAMVAWNLPVDDAAISYPSGTPSSGQKILRLDKTTAKLARPGYDVDTATDAQLVFGGAATPIKVAASGYRVLNGGASTDISLPAGIPAGELSVEAVLTDLAGGGEAFQPPLVANSRAFWTDRNVSYSMSFAYDPETGVVNILNLATFQVGVRFIITINSVAGPTSGAGGKVIDRGASHIRFMRPGASAAPNYSDVLFDSRLCFPPMVAEGWVASASFANATGGDAYATKKADVTFSNDGTWYPLPIWAYTRTDPTYGTIITGGAIKETYASAFGAPTRARQSSFARIENTKITFFANPTSFDHYWYDWTGASCSLDQINARWLTFVGVRYFVFAVPASL